MPLTPAGCFAAKMAQRRDPVFAHCAVRLGEEPAARRFGAERLEAAGIVIAETPSAWAPSPTRWPDH